MRVKYWQKDKPVPKGWRFEPLKYHYDPAAGYGLLIRENKEQILVSVYDDGLLITIDGVSHFLEMNGRQMLDLSLDLIERGKK